MPSDQNKLSFIGQLHNFVRTKTQDAYQNLAKGIPGHISKILENDFVEFTIDAVGPYTLPKIQIPQAFSKYHREPTAVGDKGVAVPTDYFIGGESGNDGSTANLYPRGNLTPLTFHPISNKNWPKKDPNLFLVTAGSSGHTTQSSDGTTTRTIDNQNNISDTSANAITSKALKTNTISSSSQDVNIVPSQSGKATVGAASDPNQNPPIPSVKTLLNIIGDISASGGISIGSPTGGNMGDGSINVDSIYINGQQPGQYKSVIVLEANSVNLVDNTVTTIMTLSLPAGAWSIAGELWVGVTNGSPSVQQIIAALQPSTTVPTNPTDSSAINVQEPNQSRSAGTGVGWVLPLVLYVNVTVTTTYYLLAKVSWTGTGSLSGYGKIAGRFTPS